MSGSEGAQRRPTAGDASEDPRNTTRDATSMQWLWRGVAAATLVIGWLFILWVNSFHITAPVVVIGLGYLAVIAMVINLYRVGASAVSPEGEGEEAWLRPIGARGELEKEKRTLLKAIKEAEFDHAMGKLSKADADEMIRMYRANAIEVIKELDRLDAGQAEGAREQIRREVQARLALDKPKKKKDKAVTKADKTDDKAKAKSVDNTAAEETDTADDKADKTDDKADKTNDKADKADKTNDKTDKTNDRAEANDKAAADAEVNDKAAANDKADKTNDKDAPDDKADTDDEKAESNDKDTTEESGAAEVKERKEARS